MFEHMVENHPDYPELWIWQKIAEGSEEGVRQALREHQEKSLYPSPRGRGIYRDGIYMDIAILSGHKHMVKLLLSLSFVPIPCHGEGWHLYGYNEWEKYWEVAGPIWERESSRFSFRLRSCDDKYGVWPIEDEEMFRMQIDAMEDINKYICLWCEGKDEEPYEGLKRGRRLDVNPTLFAMMTGNRERLEWLLSQGGSLENGALYNGGLNGSRVLYPMMNPFNVDSWTDTDALEVAILSGDPAMVAFAVERSREAAFYWSRRDLSHCGRMWYPRPRDWGRDKVYRMERVVSIADREMWERLEKHFHEELSRIPMASILEMGAGALADIRFEQLWARGDDEAVAAHMRELEQWASYALKSLGPYGIRGVKGYFVRHKERYLKVWSEEYACLKQLFFLFDLGRYFIRDSVRTRKKAEKGLCEAWKGELVEFYSKGILHVEQLFSWYDGCLSLIEENVPRAEVLAKGARERGVRMVVEGNLLEDCFFLDKEKAFVYLVLFDLYAGEKEWSLDQLVEMVCSPKAVVAWKQMGQSELPECIIRNGFLTTGNYLAFLERLEERGEQELLERFIIAGNREPVQKAGRLPRAVPENTGFGGLARARKKMRDPEAQLALYRSIREKEKGREAELLLRVSGAERGEEEEELTCVLMEEVRRSEGRFLELCGEVWFWNSAVLFSGYLNLTGLAIVFRRKQLLRALLDYREELLKKGTNPASGYFHMPWNAHVELKSFQTCIWNGILKHANSGGALLTGKVGWISEKKERLVVLGYSFTPATLAVFAGDEEILSLFKERGFLSPEDGNKMLITLGEKRVMDWLLSQELLTKRRSDLNDFMDYANPAALSWMKKNGFLKKDECKQLISRYESDIESLEKGHIRRYTEETPLPLANNADVLRSCLEILRAPSPEVPCL